jgi:hypothetical protein
MVWESLLRRDNSGGYLSRENKGVVKMWGCSGHYTDESDEGISLLRRNLETGCLCL